MSAIPRLIFQTWKAKTDISHRLAHWSATFRTENPAYRHWLWDDDDNLRFVWEQFPALLRDYEALPAEIYRVDLVRYLFLYHYGGVYADMDVECLRSLDPIRLRGGVVLGRMGSDPDFEHSIPNAVMASAPGEEFWLLVLHLVSEQGPERRPEYATGPVVLKRAYDLYSARYDTPYIQRGIEDVRQRLGMPRSRRSQVTVMPGHVLFPLDWHDPAHAGSRQELLHSDWCLDHATVKFVFSQATTVTYWMHSWEAEAR